MPTYLDFERDIAALEGRIEELRHQAGDGHLNIADEVAKLQARAERLLRQAYAKLTPEQTLQVARHPDRPRTLDYIDGLIEEFTPLAGDRASGDDPAIVGGLGRFDGASVVVVGHERGSDPAARRKRRDGRPGPEGFRKARRLMLMAERFRLPLITFVDTPGAATRAHAVPGALAQCLATALGLGVPIVAVVAGEGGGGSAMALSIADQILMLEHAVYWTVPPNEAAGVLWRDRDKAAEAAEQAQLTAQDMSRLELIDEIVPEPLGGAHRDKPESVDEVRHALQRALDAVRGQDGGILKNRRRQKYLDMGAQGA